MIEWILNIIEHYEYAGVFVLMLLENAVPMLPSEIILPASGYAVAQGKLDFAATLVAASAGSLAGVTIWYALGRWISNARVERFFSRHGHWLAVYPDEYRRASEFFARHQRSAVLLGRLLPGIRSVISVPAGLVKMPLGSFLLLSAIGTTLWSALLLYAGFALQDTYQDFTRYINWFSNGIIGLLVVMYLWHLVMHKRRKAVE